MTKRWRSPFMHGLVSAMASAAAFVLVLLGVAEAQEDPNSGNRWLRLLNWVQEYYVVLIAVAGPPLAYIGGLLTVWWQWNIEKQRMKVQRRRDLIDRWRQELIPLFAEPAEARKNIMGTEAYASLSQHLSKKVRRDFESNIIFAVRGGENYWLAKMTAEIARIERKWRLI